MYCKKCGSKIEDGNRFCENCGANVDGVTSSSDNAVKRENKEKSNAPLILGIVGGCLYMPSAICSGMCASMVDSVADSPSGELSSFYVTGLLIPAIMSIVFACVCKKNSKLSGIMLLIAAAIGGILSTCSFNLLGIVSTVLVLISGILCLTEKNKVSRMLYKVNFFGLELYTYNVLIIVGIVVGMITFLKSSKAYLSENEQNDIIMILGFVLPISFISAILGNKIQHFTSIKCFYDIFFTYTGMSFLCGLLGGAVSFSLFYRMIFKNFNRLFLVLNCMTPSFIIGQMCGRLGCFLGGCCYGKPSKMIFALAYPYGSFPYSVYGNQRLIPVQLLEIIMLLFILGSIKFIRISNCFMFYLKVYFAGRFVLEFLRGDDRGNYLFRYLSPSQCICILGLLIIWCIQLNNMVTNKTSRKNTKLDNRLK